MLPSVSVRDPLVTVTAIDLTTSGDNTIKTPATGKRLAIVALLLMSSDGVNVVAKLGSTAYTGALPIGVLEWELKPILPDGRTFTAYLTGAADEAFKLNCDSTNRLTGAVWTMEI